MSARGRPQTINLKPGRRFERLVVLAAARTKPTPARPNGRPGALCECDCGATLVVAVSDLVSGNTTSCGCLQAERRRENGLASRDRFVAMSRSPQARERVRQMALSGRIGIRKLNREKAAAIRAEYAAGAITQGALAVRYEVCPRTIWCVLNGKSWQEPGP